MDLEGRDIDGAEFERTVLEWAKRDPNIALRTLNMDLLQSMGTARYLAATMPMRLGVYKGSEMVAFMGATPAWFGAVFVLLITSPEHRGGHVALAASTMGLRQLKGLGYTDAIVLQPLDAVESHAITKRQGFETMPVVVRHKRL